MHIYVRQDAPALTGIFRLKKGRAATMRFPLIPIFLLALPLLEIAGFVLVGRHIGVLPTIGLVIASSIAGFVLLRIQGFGIMARIQKEMAAGRDPSRELAHGVMILLAGILLVIPGFLTDILGLLLFLPPIRDLAWKLLKSRMAIVTRFGTGGFSRAGPASGGKIIDLDEADYSEAADETSPWRRLDRD